MNNRIIVLQIKVKSLKLNLSETSCGFCSNAAINLEFSIALNSLKDLKAQSLEFQQIFYSSYRCPNLVLNFLKLFKLKTSDQCDIVSGTAEQL